MRGTVQPCSPPGPTVYSVCVSLTTWGLVQVGPGACPSVSGCVTQHHNLRLVSVVTDVILSFMRYSSLCCMAHTCLSNQILSNQLTLLVLTESTHT